MDEEFATEELLQQWLVEERGVPQEVAATVAPVLFDDGYVRPSMLLNIQQTLLGSLRIGGPHQTLLFNKLQQPSTQLGAIQQLVERQDQQQRSDAELRALLRGFLVSHADPYVAVSAAHYSRDDSRSVKEASIAYYGLGNAKFCQVLGPVDPNHVSVVNAHIWPRSAAQDLVLFGIEPEEIHSERNVLRLQKDIERAFDHQDLAFVENNAGLLVAKVVNPTILSKSLTGTSTTFRDIQNAPLLLPSGSFPFRRLIAHHSVLSHKKARARRWIGDDLSEVEVRASALAAHSLDLEAQARLKFLWNTTSA